MPLSLLSDMSDDGTKVTGEIDEQVMGTITGEVTGEVCKLLKILEKGPLRRVVIQSALKLKSQANFRDSYLIPALDAGLIENTLKKRNSPVPQKTWKAATQASDKFNRLSLILKTLNPRVIVIIYKDAKIKSFFEGLKYIELPIDEPGSRRYRLEEYDTDILHTFHPNQMRNRGGPWSFLNHLKKILKEISLTPDYPEFVSKNEAGETITRHLLDAYKRNKGKELKPRNKALHF